MLNTRRKSSQFFLCQWAKPLSGFVLCPVVAGVFKHFGQVRSLGTRMICFARRCLEEIKDAAAILEESGIWVNRTFAKHFGTGFLWFSFIFNEAAFVIGALKQVQSPEKEYWSSAEGHCIMLQKKSCADWPLVDWLAASLDQEDISELETSVELGCQHESKVKALFWWPVFKTPWI